MPEMLLYSEHISGNRNSNFYLSLRSLPVFKGVATIDTIGERGMGCQKPDFAYEGLRESYVSIYF